MLSDAMRMNCSLDEVCSDIKMHSLQAPFLRAQRRPLSGQALRQSAPTAQRLQNAREEPLCEMLLRRFLATVRAAAAAAAASEADVCVRSVIQAGGAPAPRFRQWLWLRRQLSSRRLMMRPSRCTASSSCVTSLWQNTIHGY
jgi:hypothetical protein